MKKSTAIQILKDQRETLKTATNIKAWRDTTNAFLEEAMDTEKQAFKDFKYYQENDKGGLYNRLSLCIDIIEQLGVHQAKKPNWFARQPTWHVIGASIAIAGGVWTTGYNVGRDVSASRIDGVSRELLIARDSLRSLSPPPMVSTERSQVEDNKEPPPSVHIDSISVQQ